MDNGKPIRESRDIDVPLLARHFSYYAGWAQLMETELRDYQPVGVVGQIIPWNFPLLMLAWKIAPAIAMGNTVVLKPASYTRLSALLFAEIVAEAVLPAGVINIITGSSSAGSMIVTHPDVDKIAFTGSTDVGRTLRHQTAGSGKKLSLELGGKSPFVVFEDADLDGAIEGVVDLIDADHLDVTRDVVPPAEIQHLLRFGQPADQLKFGEGTATENQRVVTHRQRLIGCAD